MSKKKKNKTTIKKTIVENPLIQEVRNIKRKINEEEKNIYELKSEKNKIVENLVDIILLNSNAQELLKKYSDITTTIENKINTQNNRKKDLELKETKLSKDENNIIKEEYDFKKIGEVDYPIGLYNSICKCPVAVCNSKQVFLSYNDVRNKRCLKHRDKKPCKHLVWLSNESIY